MKTKMFLLLTLLFLLYSCDSDNQEINFNKELELEDLFTFKNGYISFENVTYYDKAVKKMSKMQRLELDALRKKFNFISLFDTYQSEESQSENNFKVQDDILAMLLNNDGILLVGDTILKVIEDRAFLICDGDFNKIDKLTNAEYQDKSIIIKNHSEVLSVVKNDDGMQKLRGTETQTFSVINYPALTMPGDPSLVLPILCTA